MTSLLHDCVTQIHKHLQSMANWKKKNGRFILDTPSVESIVHIYA